MTPFEVVYAAAVFAVGGVVQALTGFGFALVCSALLAFVFDVRTITLVVLLVGVPVISSILVRCFRTDRGSVQVHLVVWLIVGMLVGRAVGTALLQRLDDRSLFRILVGVLGSISVYYLVIEQRIAVKPSRAVGALMGTAAGILGGLFSIGAVTLSPYARALDLPPVRYVASLQMVTLSGVALSLVLHLWLGSFTEPVLRLGGVGALSCLLGTSVGHAVLRRIDPAIYRVVIKWFVLAVCAALIAVALIEA